MKKDYTREECFVSEDKSKKDCRYERLLIDFTKLQEKMNELITNQQQSARTNQDNRANA